MHMAYTSSSQTESQHEGGDGGTESHPHLRSYSQTIPARNEKSVFSSGVTLGVPTTLRVGPMVKRRWPTPIGAVFYVRFLFCFGIFFVFCFLAFFEREKEHDIGWVEG